MASRLSPAEMFPARRPELRVRYLHLESGIRVRTVECGESDAPLLLMLPGWGCTVYVFRENFVPLAAAGYRVVAVDLKGHGLSDKPTDPAEYRTEAMRRHVLEIIDALGAPVILSGLSMGAGLAAHAAATAPALVRGVVMVSPVGFAGVPGVGAARLLTPSMLNPLIPKLANRVTIRTLLALVNGKLREISERDVDEYWAPTQFPEFPLATRHLLHEFEWDAPFRKIDVPALMISGARDRFVSKKSLDSYSRVMPEMKHIVIRNAGHVVYDEAAPVVNDAILEFVSKISGVHER